jgi:pimeloyl-ACP methyl ester carboxylesterase
VGEEDGITPPADAESMAQAVPGADLAVLDGVGHVSAAEAPDAFNALVVDFVLSLA